MEIKKEKITKLTQEILNNFKNKSDPYGSYTGNSLDGQLPVQDADDL